MPLQPWIPAFAGMTKERKRQTEPHAIILAVGKALRRQLA
jgi:hypothetical protein